MPLTLQHLLSWQELGLRLLTDPHGHDRPVRGAHAIELPDPGRWIEPDWLVLTTGIALTRSADRQRGYARSAADAGAAAIGFGVEVCTRQVPRALLEEAESHGLPVLSVPLETPFGRVVRSVMEEVIQHPDPEVGQLLGMQERLLAAAAGPEPERGVCERLAELVGGDGGILSLADGPVVNVGHPPWGALREVAQSGHGFRVLEDWLTVCVPIETGAEPTRFLALVAPREERTRRYLRPLARFAGVLLQMAAAGRRAEVAQERALRAALLGDLAGARTVSHQLLERLKSFGFDPAQPVRCAVVLGPGDHEGERIVAALDRLFAERQIARLVRDSKAEVLSLWQGPYTGAGLVDVLGSLELDGQPPLGVGPTVSLDDPLDRAVAGARAAALRAARVEERCAVYEELDFGDLVLAGVPAEWLSGAPSPLEALRTERGEMVETLIAYLEHDMDVTACAKALHLHPNSLRYRLSKVEERLGRSLRSAATISDLYLALRAERLHGTPPPRSLPAADRQAARRRARLV